MREIELVVQMRSGRSTRVAGERDDLSPRDHVARRDEHGVVVAVHGGDAVSVIDENEATADAVVAGAAHDSVRGGADLRAGRNAEVDPRV